MESRIQTNSIIWNLRSNLGWGEVRLGFILYSTSRNKILKEENQAYHNSVKLQNPGLALNKIGYLREIFVHSKIFTYFKIWLKSNRFSWRNFLSVWWKQYSPICCSQHSTSIIASQCRNYGSVTSTSGQQQPGEVLLDLQWYCHSLDWEILLSWLRNWNGLGLLCCWRPNPFMGVEVKGMPTSLPLNVDQLAWILTGDQFGRCVSPWSVLFRKAPSGTGRWAPWPWLQIPVATFDAPKRRRPGGNPHGVSLSAMT